MRDDVKAAVPVWKPNRFGTNSHIPGLLRDSIGVFRERHPEDMGAAEVYYVGTRRLTRTYANTSNNRRKRRVGKKYKIAGAAYYVMFVEFGTSTTGLGRPGQNAQRPFTKVFEADKENSVAMFSQSLGPDLDKTVAKLATQPAATL
jgi:hypothetical protein